jgi:hypothetical protein
MGQCRIELGADGWGNARFRLDPAVHPDSQSRTVSVLATEMACAGGQAPKGRQVRAVVLDETDEVVSIVILVECPTGGQTCPGNPSFEFQVDLGSPLGNRTILDASVYPPLEREWSPSEGRIRPTLSALGRLIVLVPMAIPAGSATRAADRDSHFRWEATVHLSNRLIYVIALRS